MPRCPRCCSASRRRRRRRFLARPIPGFSPVCSIAARTWRGDISPAGAVDAFTCCRQGNGPGQGRPALACRSDRCGRRRRAPPLMVGLSRTDAAAASLLLTLEGVATALMAWFIFHENFDRRIALGMACLVAGAAVLSWSGQPTLSRPGRAAGHRRRLSRLGARQQSDPQGLALRSAADRRAERPHRRPLQLRPWPVDGRLFCRTAGHPGRRLRRLPGLRRQSRPVRLALRHLGTARTGAYFATAPFFGAAAAVVALASRSPCSSLPRPASMGIGVWLHLTEHHEHTHRHAPTAHAHVHSHDDHHRHEHGPDDPRDEPHAHWHRHDPLEHGHPHLPDAHHRHRH